jgi:hypothetical protein
LCPIIQSVRRLRGKLVGSLKTRLEVPLKFGQIPTAANWAHNREARLLPGKGRGAEGKSEAVGKSEAGRRIIRFGFLRVPGKGRVEGSPEKLLTMGFLSDLDDTDQTVSKNELSAPPGKPPTPARDRSRPLPRKCQRET